MVKSARRREDLIQMVIIDMNQRVRLHRADWRSLIVVVQVEGGGEDEGFFIYKAKLPRDTAYAKL